MVQLLESEWEIGGVRFGIPSTSGLGIMKVTLGEWAVDVNDTPDPRGPGVLPGQDVDRGATWSFDVVTGRQIRDEKTAFRAIAPLLQVWASGRDLAPLETMPLQFAAGGRQLVVYGRPRRYSHPIPDLLSKQGKVVAVLDFFITDPLVYEVDPATESGRCQVVLTLLRPTSSGGVIWKPGGADQPFWWGGSSEQARVGLIDPGPQEVPFTVRIHGPISSPAIRSDGWEIAFTGRGGLTLAHDRWVDVDTRAGTAVLDNGTSVASYLSRTSRLTARLQPGPHDVTVTGVDPTGTATFTVSWQYATRTLARS